MLSELIIPKKQRREASTDHSKLYLLGLEKVRELSSQLWTDFNVHDPGVTMLEVLCYAITDLGYRSSMPITDLLASAEDNPANMQSQFFSAAEILPNRPLTELDYRKLLIDLPGVKNAWIKPASLSYYADIIHKQLMHSDSGDAGVIGVDIGGLYDVRIDFMDGLKSSERASVLSEVEKILQQNRNLCEDFVSISQVATEDWILCGEFELQPDANIAGVKAEIMFQVQEYLAPAVANYSLEEMLQKTRADGSHYSADEIFNGPSLSTGFIPDEELNDADLRREVRLSDIINIIMDIAGVVAVRDIQINPKALSGPLQNKWLVSVADDKKVRLLVNDSRLVFYKRNMPMAAKGSEFISQLDVLTNAARVKLETVRNDNFEIPQGRFRNPESYHAMQNHLPAVYGVSDAGLPAAADSRRIAEARQLKAYLLFFEQILADYFAQLARLPELFSTDPDLLRSNFHQVVDSFSDWQEIYDSDPGTTDQERKKTIQDMLGGLENAEVSVERRNRFLDHLIARFAEQFHDFAHIMYASFDVGPEKLVRYKCNFLNDYPVISSERGLAYNCSLSELSDLWNSENISGLEKRLTRLLGIDNSTRRNLSDVAYDIYAEIDTTPGDEFRFRIRNRVDGDILLSSSRNFVTEDEARAEMRRAILFGSELSSYSSKTGSNGKFYFNVVDENHILAARRQGFDTESEMQGAISEVMEYLRVNYSEEGMYLVENILLRPQQTGDPFLPICVDTDCVDCAEADPYSYRIQIILPAYGTRFRDQDFRNFAERVIRAEVPAHILPRICWINKDDMAALEKAYQDWLKIKSGRSTANRALKIRRFVKLLNSVKNIYPLERLHECDGEERSKFIIGHKALGSFNPRGNDA
jgi:hypothetical protein